MKKMIIVLFFLLVLFTTTTKVNALYSTPVPFSIWNDNYGEGTFFTDQDYYIYINSDFEPITIRYDFCNFPDSYMWDAINKPWGWSPQYFGVVVETRAHFMHSLTHYFSPQKGIPMLYSTGQCGYFWYTFPRNQMDIDLLKEYGILFLDVYENNNTLFGPWPEGVGGPTSVILGSHAVILMPSDSFFEPVTAPPEIPLHPFLDTHRDYVSIAIGNSAQIDNSMGVMHRTDKVQGIYRFQQEHSGIDVFALPLHLRIDHPTSMYDFRLVFVDLNGTWSHTIDGLTNNESKHVLMAVDTGNKPDRPWGTPPRLMVGDTFPEFYDILPPTDSLIYYFVEEYDSENETVNVFAGESLFFVSSSNNRPSIYLPKTNFLQGQRIPFVLTYNPALIGPYGFQTTFLGNNEINLSGSVLDFAESQTLNFEAIDSNLIRWRLEYYQETLVHDIPSELYYFELEANYALIEGTPFSKAIFDFFPLTGLDTPVGSVFSYFVVLFIFILLVAILKAPPIFYILVISIISLIFGLVTTIPIWVYVLVILFSAGGMTQVFDKGGGVSE